ncbi:MAG: Fe-S cluster assembly protein SufD [Bacteroidota bacterium]
MDHTTVINTVQEKFNSFEKGLNGEANSLLHKARKGSLESLSKNGFPKGGKDEEYKYTDLTSPLVKDFIEILGQTEESKESFEDLIDYDLDANIVVFVNGQFSNELSKIISPETQIKIASLAKESNSEAISHSNESGAQADGFLLLNNAFAQDGAIITIPRNVTVEKPVVIYYISDATKRKSLVQPRNVFMAEENSEVQIIESFKSKGTNENFTNTSTQIKVEKNARVQHAKLQIELDEAYHVGNTQVLQEDGSTFTNTTITFGGKSIRNNLDIEIDGSGAEANMFGLFVLNEKQHVDNHTSVDHKKPHSLSNEFYKGILDDSSEGVFNGKIFVRQDAQKTNAFQSNNNILLSDKATINTKPQLEIWADDVKCSHGATTGQIDENQMFYLRARGLDKDHARAILLHAFAQEVIDKIKIEPLKDFLTKKLEERLSDEL